MEDNPPDLNRSNKQSSSIAYDSNKILKFNTPGEKYLIISRELDNNDANTNASLNNVSPFLIKKVIDATCTGGINLCKKLKNGTILIQTKNVSQAAKLINLRSLSETIKVNVTEHNSLNCVKGVIYANGLKGISKDEILSELKDQNIIDLHKIMKKNSDNEVIETGLIILTFASISLPQHVYIGYERVNVRVYIPLPLRCNNCLLFGHIAKYCNNNKICPDCSGTYHTNKENNESCTKVKCCINCKKENSNEINHSAYDKSCPIFLKEKEIQAIVTIEKVNRSTALSTYQQRHPIGIVSYSEMTKQYSNPTTILKNNTTETPLNNKNITNAHNKSNTASLLKSNTKTRATIDYNDILKDNTLNTISNTKKSKVTILPLSTSNRNRAHINKIVKNKTPRPRILLPEDENLVTTDADMKTPPFIMELDST